MCGIIYWGGEVYKFYKPTRGRARRSTSKTLT
jgi:hypothetical protein